jgi:putative PIN family toxin of toxin-antitoxin system
VLRVVHDTNVAVSALLFRTGTLAWLRDAWFAGTVMPLVCNLTIAELVRVLAYPKFDLAVDEVDALLACYLGQSEKHPDPGTSVRVPRCRDEDDRLFLRLAYAARADALVTGDADLLALATESRVRIVTPAVLHTLVERRPRGFKEPRATYRIERSSVRRVRPPAIPAYASLTNPSCSPLNGRSDCASAPKPGAPMTS